MATAEELRRAREATSIFSGLFGYIDERNRRLAEQGRRPVLGGLLSKEPVMGTDTLRYEGVLPLVAGLLEPIARGVDAPRAAAQGLIPQEDMIGEAFGTAGTAMLGGGVAAKPAGSLGAFYGREGGSIQDALELSRSGRAIFHSSQADQFDEINRYGVEPQYGPWVKEIAEGATDDPSFLDDMPMAAWWSEQPDWVKMKTARAAGKSVNDVTVDDIRKYGHLSIADADEYADTVYRIPEEGIDYEGSEVSNLSGERMPLYATDLYEYGDDGVGRYPFGIERNELVTRESVEPKYSLTGQELVDFLEQYDGDTVSANASKSAGLLTTSAAELRRQANIQRFGYDPNETPKVDTSYRGSHQPVGPQDENPIRLDDVTKSITGEDAGYPDDFYSSQGMRLYAQPPSFPGDEYGIANQQSYRAIQAARGNPNAEVTIYRGVPDSDDITTINPGDFVTLSPKYAELHAASGYGPRGEDAGKVISQRVKVRDVYFAGDDVNEFGYFPTDVAANASKSAGVLSVVNKYPEIDIDIYGSADRGYELGKIKVPEGSQGSGVGTQVMNELISAADAEGARISLTPDTSFGGSSVSRLKDFYKRFGFVENKGRNKDFSTRNTMYRDPLMANASKPIGLLVLEQQARGNKQLGGLLQSQGMDINDLSTADPFEIQGLLDIAARRGILDKRSAAGLKRGLLE